MADIPLSTDYDWDTVAEQEIEARRDAGCCGHTGYGCSCGPACRCGCPGCPACGGAR